jgi:thiamine biosynthesis lipoprotein
MATVFEIVIVHDDAGYAEQCSHEAFRGVDRLEQALSRFVENSDISRINNAPVGEAVRVGIDAFECLEHCVRLSAATNGACDVTMGLLSEYWSGVEASGHAPASDRLAEIRQGIGMQQIELDPGQNTVTRRADRVSIDLGGYGKGHAVDRMADVLDDWGISSALLHGGTSSVLALGAAPGQRGWPVTLRDPSAPDQVIERFHLRRSAMSGSGLGKGHHIIDPRTARPATETRAAWTVTKTAAASDALATAFMILSPEEIRAYCDRHQETLAVVLRADAAGAGDVLRFGDLDDLR